MNKLNQACNDAFHIKTIQSTKIYLDPAKVKKKKLSQNAIYALLPEFFAKCTIEFHSF